MGGGGGGGEGERKECSSMYNLGTNIHHAEHFVLYVCTKKTSPLVFVFNRL